MTAPADVTTLAAEAAVAMQKLNRLAKDCQRSTRNDIYDLKTLLTRQLYRRGFCVGVEAHTGSEPLHAFWFDIGGTLFMWHLPTRDVQWSVEWQTPPPRRSTELRRGHLEGHPRADRAGRALSGAVSAGRTGKDQWTEIYRTCSTTLLSG